MSENPDSGNLTLKYRIGGVAWIAAQLGLSERQVRRLAVQRKLAGIFRAQKGDRWKVNKAQFLGWHEGRKTKI